MLLLDGRYYPGRRERERSILEKLNNRYLKRDAPSLLWKLAVADIIYSHGKSWGVPAAVNRSYRMKIASIMSHDVTLMDTK